MKKKKRKPSVAEEIMKIINKQPKFADELRREIKDELGHNEKPADIRVNLLYLLRRGKIRRSKEDREYKYFI